MNNSKKSLLMSSISLLLCISMFIGSTFAWFTDSASSAGNKIHAGILKLDVELLDKATSEWSSLKEMKEPIFNYDKWEPGYMDTKVFKIENEGNLALKWAAKFYSEHELSILADVIDVYVYPSDSKIGYPTDRNLENYTCVGNLRTFINSTEDTTYGNLEPDQESYLGIALKMREEAGNEYQGLSLGGAFDIRIYATQYTSEYDSFGNDYDQDATFDELANTSIMATASETLVAGADSVDFDLSDNGLYVAKVIVPASAIADSSQPVTVTFDGIKPSEAAIVDDNTQAYAFDIKVTNLKENLEGDQLVTVIVTAPNALAAMKAYHNGTLIEDAVYDEVKGTVTFKTANFSPFDFTTQIIDDVSNLEGLREALQKNDHTAKLMDNITVDLTKDTGSARDASHAYSKYYNGVMINGKNVALDLNGHNITAFCGDAYNSNSDVGALFFVGKNGSLNITNTGNVSTGFIKMENSIYAVWAPFSDPSYVDIYGGAFIADSYAGDPIAPGGSNYNENSNRALIYAGTGGNMNIYGGYFLYNNTPDDDTDRNNGAFNAKDHYTGGPLITIHEGVYLSNKEYRQNPNNTSTPNGTFDNESVKLVDEIYYRVSPVKLNEPVVIDGVKYVDWYKVSRNFKYKITFMDSAGKNALYTHRVESNDNPVYIKEGEEFYEKAVDALLNSDPSYNGNFGGWVTAGSQNMTTIPAGQTNDIILYPSYDNKITVRFVDQNGNLVYDETISQGGAVSKVPDVPALDDFEGKWEDNWQDKVKKAKDDITIYPVYEYNGNLSLKPVDEDGDGETDYYQVESVDNLDKTVRVPGYVNGYPVKIVQKLTASSWDDTTTVIFEEGIEILKAESLAGTPDLSTVYLPKTLTTIENKAFSSNVLGMANKKIKFTYNGTKEDFEKISLSSGWDQGLADGTTITCSDGKVYELDRNWNSYTWIWKD